MIFSAQQLFSDAQAVTGDAVSTNVIDTGVRGTPYDAAAALSGDIGKGNKICILVQVVTKFLTCTSVTFNIETGTATSLGTIIASQTVLLADLLVGKQLNFDVLPNGVTERYLGIRYDVNGSNATAGAVTSGITLGNQTNITGV